MIKQQEKKKNDGVFGVFWSLHSPYNSAPQGIEHHFFIWYKAKRWMDTRILSLGFAGKLWRHLEYT